MNKLYYFHGHDEESGVFVGAKTWRDARNYALGHPCTDDSSFTEIGGSLRKENGKPCYTEASGEMECHEILASGYTRFWWSGECDKCGKWNERLTPLAPFSAEMICSECENPEDDQ